METSKVEAVYEIVVEASFSATHALRSPDGATEPIHGHDWRVSVTLAADELDGAGYVADFEDVGAELHGITRELHHAHLNEHPWLAGANPTAERVAELIFDRLARVASWGGKVADVTVIEAPGCAARYVRRRIGDRR